MSIFNNETRVPSVGPFALADRDALRAEVPRQARRAQFAPGAGRGGARFVRPSSGVEHRCAEGFPVAFDLSAALQFGLQAPLPPRYAWGAECGSSSRVPLRPVKPGSILTGGNGTSGTFAPTRPKVEAVSIRRGGRAASRWRRLRITDMVVA